ncbi:hypothetical protein ACFKHW_00065 [Bradyrhizobium lupini]|uniref:hypothetical protein n=1 Tax=Rhizobium lupini TaxID=136996 RepID=UPI00366AB42B
MSYRADKARHGEEGSRTRALWPGATAPPTLTTPSTPHLNGGPVSADESTCRFKPAWKRSIRTQGVLRPVSFHDRSGSKLDECPKRHPLKVQAGGGDVFAQVPRCDLKAGIREGCKELGRKQVNLSKIGQARSAAGEIAVPDESAGVGVAFDAMSFHQHDPVLRRFAEVVTAIGGNCDDGALQREAVPLLRQAARANERRFWRR